MISCGERHGIERWLLGGKWRADTEDLSSTSESSKTQDESPKTKKEKKEKTLKREAVPGIYRRETRRQSPACLRATPGGASEQGPSIV